MLKSLWVCILFFLLTLFGQELFTIEVNFIGNKEGVCYIEKLCGVPWSLRGADVADLTYMEWFIV